MIDLKEVYNGRWQVIRPFYEARSQNFVLYLVEDLQLQDLKLATRRLALLKTIRKRDMPSAELHEQRRALLRAEIATAGDLVNPTLPEPLDCITLEDGEHALVYSMVGQATGNYLLRDYLNFRWRKKDGKFQPSFVQEYRNNSVRLIERIARYLEALAKFTEDLWNKGFVHTNLCPDHLYILKDDLLRVTGLSAICRHQHGTILAPQAPGLRNMAIGYGSQEQRQAVLTGSPVELDAARLRWSTFSVLALELIWGRNIREYCRERGIESLLLNKAAKDQIKQDFPSLFRLGQMPPEGKKALNELMRLLTLCLTEQSELPSDLFFRFTEVFKEMDDQRIRYYLRVEEREFQRHGERWKERLRVVPDQEIEVMVTRSEKVETFDNQSNNKRAYGWYKVRRLSSCDPHKGKESFNLRVPPRHKLFFPGDIIPAQMPPIKTKIGRPIGKKIWDGEYFFTLFPAGTARDSGLNRLQEMDGQEVRALSMGRLNRTIPGIQRNAPWAVVDLDGFLTAMPVSEQEGQKFKIFPRYGRFHQYTVVRKGAYSLVLVPIDPPMPKLELRGRFVIVDHVATSQAGKPMAFFDIPVGEDHMASCMLPKGLWPRGVDIQPGTRLPIRIKAVNTSIDVEWDAQLAGGAASIGKEYLAKVTHAASAPVVVFGDRGQFHGRVARRSIQWGMPVYSWKGRELMVKVKAVRNQSKAEYHVDYAGPPLTEGVEEVFLVGETLRGKVVHHSPDKSGFLVQLAAEPDGERMEVAGQVRVNSRDFPLAVRTNLAGWYPLEREVEVKIMKVDPEKRAMDLKLTGLGNKEI